ncbi:MAG: sialate O-acetylesterase, partial [Bacteroidetes bacterium]|nr:sialate O-acetylesterase [Bacteroidota bacterium]
MKSFTGILLFVFLSNIVSAQLRLPAIISSGMVLQQNDSATIWGWGNSSEKVKVSGSWDNKTDSTIVNNLGKWTVKLKTPSAGGPYTVIIKQGAEKIVLTDVLIGEVWLCSGQSNMEMNSTWGARFIKDSFSVCYNRNIRFFQEPRTTSEYPQDDIKASWMICDSNSLRTFSAVGYFFGKKLQQDLNVPVGLIHASWGGTPAEVWTPSEYIDKDTVLKKAAALQPSYPWWPDTPGANYNGMLAPVKQFDIAGAIWYQGEGNTIAPSAYARLLTTMIDAWRDKWKKDIPFYLVQIAPYKYGNKNVGALIQEQQTMVMKHHNTGMVVTTDLIDSVTNIHPSDKRLVGQRLANWALAETYHLPGIVYKSPQFNHAEIKKDKLVLTFDNA